MARTAPRKRGMEPVSRRMLLGKFAVLSSVAAFPTVVLGAAADGLQGLEEPRRLDFHHTHTSEKLRIVYAENGQYLPDALAEIDHFLRDFRTGHVHRIDAPLLDTLHMLRQATGSNKAYEIISGFRSPATNAMLGARSGGVAKRSLHMDGKAVDVRLPGIPTAKLRAAALKLKRGGVGYYPESDFVHLDSGRVRFW